MNKPFFTAEDFGRMHPVDLCGGIKEKMITTAEASQLANTKVAPLIAENRRLQEQLTEASGEVERLRDENRKILKELNATTQGRENAYKEQEKLNEQNRIMKEALTEINDKADMTILGPSQYDDCRDEKQAHEIGAHKAFGQQAEIAREALAKCRELE